MNGNQHKMKAALARRHGIAIKEIYIDKTSSIICFDGCSFQVCADGRAFDMSNSRPVYFTDDELRIDSGYAQFMIMKMACRSFKDKEEIIRLFHAATDNYYCTPVRGFQNILCVETRGTDCNGKKTLVVKPGTIKAIGMKNALCAVIDLYKTASAE